MIEISVFIFVSSCASLWNKSQQNLDLDFLVYSLVVLGVANTVGSASSLGAGSGLFVENILLYLLRTFLLN